MLTLRCTIKGSLTRDFRFFHESVSPVPLNIPLGPFRNFKKICGDIRNFMFIVRVNDTGNTFNAKVVYISG
jgi:hypothetical protein